MRTTLALIVVTTTLVPGVALASGDYPKQLARDGWAPTKPECSLCHVSGMTGYDSVHTPFGTSMRLRGLVAGDSASLTRALEQMMADEVDSDDDGVTDVEELAAGTDPSSPTDYTEPRFGCVVGPADARPSTGSYALALVVAAILARRTSRRRRQE